MTFYRAIVDLVMQQISVLLVVSHYLQQPPLNGERQHIPNFLHLRYMLKKGRRRQIPYELSSDNQVLFDVPHTGVTQQSVSSLTNPESSVFVDRYVLA